MGQETTIDRHCLGCKYYCTIWDGMCYCNYIFQVGKRRPCAPGKDCTVKEKGRPPKVKGCGWT